MERSDSNRKRPEARAEYIVRLNRLGKLFKWFGSPRVVSSSVAAKQRREGIVRDIL